MAIIARDLEPFVSLSFFLHLLLDGDRASPGDVDRRCKGLHSRKKLCEQAAPKKQGLAPKEKHGCCFYREKSERSDTADYSDLVRHRHLGPLDVSGSSAVAEGIGLGIVIVAQ